MNFDEDIEKFPEHAFGRKKEYSVAAESMLYRAQLLEQIHLGYRGENVNESIKYFSDFLFEQDYKEI